MEQETKHPRIDNKKNTDGMKNILSARHAFIAEDTGLIPSWILDLVSCTEQPKDDQNRKERKRTRRILAKSLLCKVEKNR